MSICVYEAPVAPLVQNVSLGRIKAGTSQVFTIRPTDWNVANPESKLNFNLSDACVSFFTGWSRSTFWKLRWGCDYHWNELLDDRLKRHL